MFSAVPAVVVVRAGVKGLGLDGHMVDVPPDHAVLIPDQVPLIIENRPDPRTAYRAEALPLSRAIVARAYGRGGVDPRTPTAPGPIALGSGMEDAFLAAAQALAHPDRYPARIRDLRLEEIVLWLAEGGVVLGPEPRPAVAHRVRALLTADPARAWKAAEVAQALAMSEPTLRRHLAGEGESFTALLADTRMTRALALLQSSTLTVEAVADAVGYASPSRFAVRFRARFGVPPRAIREPIPAD
jgi:AraC-like DNA-binding protein